MNKSLNKTEDFMAVIAGLLILFSMVSVVLEVVVRSIYGHSFIWVQEYNEYFLLYIAFLSGAWLLRKNDHVIINLIDSIIGSNSSRMLNVFVAVLGMISMIVIVYYGTIVTLDIIERGVKSTTILKTPQVYVYIVIPIGSFLMLLEFLRKFIKAINSQKET